MWNVSREYIVNTWIFRVVSSSNTTSEVLKLLLHVPPEFSTVVCNGRVRWTMTKCNADCWNKRGTCAIADIRCRCLHHTDPDPWWASNSVNLDGPGISRASNSCRTTRNCTRSVRTRRSQWRAYRVLHAMSCRGAACRPGISCKCHRVRRIPCGWARAAVSSWFAGIDCPAYATRTSRLSWHSGTDSDSLNARSCRGYTYAITISQYLQLDKHRFR